MVEYLIWPTFDGEEQTRVSGINRMGRALRRVAVPALLAIVVLAGCAGGPERDDETGELLAAADIGVFDLQVGDCLADFDDEDEVTTVHAVPCAEEHSAEIFAALEFPDGDEYPGDQAVKDFADDECPDRFEQFVGVPWEESEFSYGYLGPTATSWDGGDREILCTVGHPHRPVTGTLENADR